MTRQLGYKHTLSKYCVPKEKLLYVCS